MVAEIRRAESAKGISGRRSVSMFVQVMRRSAEAAGSPPRKCRP